MAVSRFEEVTAVILTPFVATVDSRASAAASMAGNSTDYEGFVPALKAGQAQPVRGVTKWDPERPTAMTLLRWPASAPTIR